MQEINFKTNAETLNYSYDVCEFAGCENRSAKILVMKININPFNSYHNVCKECYKKVEKYV